MGSSVRINLKNPTPEQRKTVEQLSSKYQYGHFNGMEDIYEYSNSRDDIPQAKYVVVNCEWDEDIKKRAWDWIRENMGGFEDAPEYEKAHMVHVHGFWGTSWICRAMNGEFEGFSI